MKYFLYSLLCISFTISAQNEADLLILQHENKLNLAPRYGNGKIKKTDTETKADKEFISKCLAEFPSKDSASQYFATRGILLFGEKALQVSVKRLNQAWLLDSTNSLCYFGFYLILKTIEDNPGKLFESGSLKINEIENPNYYYEQGLKLDKNKQAERIALEFAATTFHKFKKIDDSFSACERLLEWNAQDTFALTQRSNLYMKKENWNAALEDLFKVSTLEKQHYLTYNNIAYIHEQLGDNSNASLYYQKSFSENKSYLKPAYNNALLQQKLGNHELALKFVDLCIEEKNDIGLFHKTRGEVLISLGRQEEGLDALKKAVKLGDEDAKIVLKKLKR